jgi:hypothetical protein
MFRHTTICLAACLAVTPRGEHDQPKPAVPIEAIGGIVDAFRTHRLVGLSEGPHGNIEGHRFRLSLIRDPRFSAIVNDIVVEFGSARYQELMDRFVRGDTVDDEALRRVWEDTTIVTPGWERPIYKEFFHAVRAVNATLPPDRQLRVLLGDPPIKWETIHTRDELRAATRARGNYEEDVIRREVLGKNRRALLIFGDGHFQGRGEGLGLSGGFEREGVELWAISSGGGMDSLGPATRAARRGELAGAEPGNAARNNAWRERVRVLLRDSSDPRGLLARDETGRAVRCAALARTDSHLR